jgi:GNAT superfamily N-acetyltransferase
MIIQPISHEQTYPLRHSVLWPDKPYEYVRVDNDQAGHHYGAFLHEDLVAVISLFVYFENGQTVARFRKFAAHPDYQRQGIGTQLMQHILAEARRMGAIRLWCDARLDAADFYRRFGMEPISDVFYKGLIPYATYSVSLTNKSS